MPAPSCPSTVGNRPEGSRPLIVYASVWQTPVAASRTRHSPARGPSSSISSMVSGVLGFQQTAALTFMPPRIAERPAEVAPRDGRNVVEPLHPVRRHDH